MKPAIPNPGRVLTLAAAAMLMAGSALAEPDWLRHGNWDGRDVRMEQRNDDARHWRNGNDYRDDAQRHRFQPRHQVIVREYYGREFHGGRCPPGLAKRHNGCLPPGHAKRWRLGYPLERDVVYYEVPPTLVMQIGAPPQGHRYVRVAGDILMIAIGTSLVVDAIEDLSGRR